MANSSRSEPIEENEPVPFIDLKAQQRRIRSELDAAMARVLDHGQFIMGPEVAELETRLAEFANVRHVITCSSGTDALLMPLMAAEIGLGDAVICPAFTFTATPETIGLIGATPVFVDVDPLTFNIDPSLVAQAVETARGHGLNPKALMSVDLFGQPADYGRLTKIADDLGLFILCDAGQAFGAECLGKKVGQFGCATATSFFPGKPLGCFGDGGAIFTDDDGLAETLRSIRLHGRGSAKYDIVRIGINSRLDTLQAAILIEKLKIFDDELARRDTAAARYSELIGNGAATPFVSPHCRSAWAQYTLKIDPDRRDKVARFLKNSGIPTNVYYPRPLHHQPAYRHFPIAGDCRVSEELPRQVLSLPMHPYLSKTTQIRISEKLQEAIA